MPSSPPGGASAGAASHALPYTHLGNKALENGPVDVRPEKNLMRQKMKVCLGYAALFVGAYLVVAIAVDAVTEGTTHDPIGRALVSLVAGG